MKRILVAYATREGHTASIAERVAGALRARGCEPLLENVADHDPFEDGPEDVDAAILAASVHIGRHERAMTSFVKKHLRALSEIPTAFVSVSLSETTAEDPNAPYDAREQARRDVHMMIERFVEDTGWRPDRTKPVAGALAYTKYGVLVRFIMKRIAERSGGSTDTTRDHVYTDWDDLDRFIGDLVDEMFEDGAIRRAAPAPHTLEVKAP